MSGDTRKRTMLSTESCGACGKRLRLTRSKTGLGYDINAKNYSERLPDGRIRTAKTPTCMKCISTRPNYRPEMGEPFEMPRRLE